MAEGEGSSTPVRRIRISLKNYSFVPSPKHVFFPILRQNSLTPVASCAIPFSIHIIPDWKHAQYQQKLHDLAASISNARNVRASTDGHIHYCKTLYCSSYSASQAVQVPASSRRQKNIHTRLEHVTDERINTDCIYIRLPNLHRKRTKSLMNFNANKWKTRREKTDEKERERCTDCTHVSSRTHRR